MPSSWNRAKIPAGGGVASRGPHWGAIGGRRCWVPFFTVQNIALHSSQNMLLNPQQEEQTILLSGCPRHGGDPHTMWAWRVLPGAGGRGGGKTAEACGGSGDSLFATAMPQPQSSPWRGKWGRGMCRPPCEGRHQPPGPIRTALVWEMDGLEACIPNSCRHTFYPGDPSGVLIADPLFPIWVRRL